MRQPNSWRPADRRGQKQTPTGKLGFSQAGLTNVKASKHCFPAGHSPVDPNAVQYFMHCCMTHANPAAQPEDEEQLAPWVPVPAGKQSVALVLSSDNALAGWHAWPAEQPAWEAILHPAPAVQFPTSGATGSGLQ
jgi:hypothetical protein